MAAALKVDFDVELALVEARPPGAPEQPATSSLPPPRAGATVFIARADEENQNDGSKRPSYVLRDESGAVLGRIPESARLPPSAPPDGGAPAEVRSVRRQPGPGPPPTVTITLSVRVVLGDGGQSWPPSRGAAEAAAEAQLRQALAAAGGGGDDEAAAADAADGYRARPEELARLALSSEVREALRDPRLQRLLRGIDGAPDRERALRAALGLPAGGGGAGGAAARGPAGAGALGVDGGAFQNFAQLVLEIMDGGGASGGGAGGAGG